MAGRVDVAKLREEFNRLNPKNPIGTVTIGLKPETFIALLDELERLRKIAKRLPRKCCLNCSNYGSDNFGLLPRNALKKCNRWLPLDGEKEE